MELLKIYESFTDVEGREITIGELVYGEIAGYHNDRQIASALIEENQVGADNESVLMYINFLDGYEHTDLSRLMFEAAEFYYGDFLIEEGLHIELSKSFSIANDDFKHLSIQTTTDKPFKC